MAWQTMVNLADGDVVDEVDMDAIRGNLEYMLAVAYQASGASANTSSTSYVSTGVSVTLTTVKGYVLIAGTVSYGTGSYGSGQALFRLDFDGINQSEALVDIRDTPPDPSMSFAYLWQPPAPGVHVITLQFKAASGTIGGAYYLRAVEV